MTSSQKTLSIDWFHLLNTELGFHKLLLPLFSILTRTVLHRYIRLGRLNVSHRYSTPRWTQTIAATSTSLLPIHVFLAPQKIPRIYLTIKPANFYSCKMIEIFSVFSAWQSAQTRADVSALRRSGGASCLKGWTFCTDMMARHHAR